MHSAGQQARRANIRRQAREPPPVRGLSSAPAGDPPPVAGGIAVTDLIILTISGVLALIRSLPLAELFDLIVATAFSASRAVGQTVWLHVRSPQVLRENPEPVDLFRLNPPFPPSSNHNIIKTGSSSHASSAPRRRHHHRHGKAPAAPTLPAGSSDFPDTSTSARISGSAPIFSSSSYSEDPPVWIGGSSPPTASHGPLPGPLNDSTAEMPTHPLHLDVSSSSDMDLETEGSTPSIMTAAGDARMTLFHHVVLVLTRFACENFPFLVPRIILAEETIAPFVRWRTGGGAGALIREYGPDESSDQDTSSDSSTNNRSFRAYWIGGDSHLTPLERRTDPVRQQATTVMWIHGGGFIMGSVAFYAESLLRILAKVCAIEYDAAINSDTLPPYPEARCIAVEYSLGPNARFPQALLECLRTYAHLVEVEGIDPESIVLAGDSAGGNLALAMILAISGQGNDPAVWDERDWTTLPLPSKSVLVSPWIDLRPQYALAFESLRSAHPTSSDAFPEQSTSEPSSQPTTGPTGQPTPNSIVSPMSEKFPSDDQTDDEASSDGSTITTDSENPTDYVVPEGLLHYAQVYTGVLDIPRRVSGPAGWIAGLLRTLNTQPTAQALDTPLPEASNNRTSGLGRSLSTAVLQVLDAPLFERSSPSAAVVLPTDAYFGMNPLYGASERASDTVSKPSQLYDSNLAFSSGGETGTARTGAQLRAAEILAGESFLSPAAGDWSNIELINGIVAVYGSHELLAPDIRRWCQASGAQSIVQHGPKGVHAWPLVNMYIAGTPSEREKGIEILARALARPRRFDACTPVPPYSYSPAGSFPSGDTSPGSMPSDAWPGSPDHHALSIDAPPMMFSSNYPLPLFGDTPSEATPSNSPALSHSDGEEEDSNKLSGTPLHTYPPPRTSTSSSFTSSGPSWWAGVAAPAASPSTRPFSLDSMNEQDTTVPTSPVAGPFVPSRLDGLSDITEETEAGSASSRPELVSRAGSGIMGRTIATPTATTTATAGRALGSPRSEATPQLQGLGSAGDRLRAYLAEGPNPNASAPPVTPTRRRPATGDVWW